MNKRFLHHPQIVQVLSSERDKAVRFTTRAQRNTPQIYQHTSSLPFNKQLPRFTHGNGEELAWPILRLTEGFDCAPSVRHQGLTKASSSALLYSKLLRSIFRR
eukprot:755090-Hanusia_phi.AAC.3